MARHALITGAAGQDGTLLAQMLAADGYRISGLVKPGTDARQLLRYCPEVALVECDLARPADVRARVVELAPDEVFNFGGISSIVESVEQPELTERVNVQAVEALLDALAELGGRPRLVQAASGAVFEGSDVSPQTEATPVSPRTPYARAKARSLELVAAARARGLHASAAVLYNHESPLRGNGFVTRRITEGVARIAAGRDTSLELGNIDVCRDWGWAPDYVRGMRLMMAADSPGDYILASGEIHTLSDFLALAFGSVGITDWQSYVVTRDDLRRTTDPTLLRGDSTKAELTLGWKRTKAFAQIAEAMVAYDGLLLEDPQALWHET